ncbi:hypothetical protein [Actinomyces trachealis]|uniref:hypothetical protein n=1 Tax=Actinomyces trachealis TaxID=2763540 RepID=UPI0018C538E5|nr:hypothetical protein [Actinomyces trachealis]
MEVGRARLAGGQLVLDLESLACPASSGPVAVGGQRYCELLWQVLIHVGSKPVGLRTLFRSLVGCVARGIQDAFYRHVTVHGDLSLIL